ncbi:ATP-dependent DNA helicase PcrA [Candidatus Peregrinibacteria bacterium HGW-Peregrinibacteria-1]|jgi:DNA helicase-2/ATP-dependent DNA helicase PcrA|nr:MAG: ATP-dependent DNA helicase PcrA [Candidatus Peregrinibacteria bacterium HGW-Peregrinibacteria-1]
MNIFEELNPKQIEAVQHVDGALLVFAGAGSGKTKALTHRIAYMIKEAGINPWNILAVTFTNKAANEMNTRIQKLLENQDQAAVLQGFGDLLSTSVIENFTANSTDLPTVGTFHAICVRILRRNIHHLDFENSFAIYDTADQEILMKRLMNELMIDSKKITPKSILAHISNAKNQLIGPDQYRQYADNYFTERVAELYPRYQSALHRSNALDFDDIIMKTVELFREHPAILAFYQEKFRYISVDEYQDTNTAQYELIKLLAEKYRNICVIGDSDQSIYRWRGANIQNILNFEKDYPEAKVILLEQNYRSTNNILNAANNVISRNQNRRDKNLWSDKDDGTKLRHWIADNERHEAEMIANEIRQHYTGTEYPDYTENVVLCRTNAQTRVIEEAFLRHGIPYKIVGGIKFYSRKEIKDLISYLRIIQNPSDSVSLLRVINTPARKIGPKTLIACQEFANRHNLSLFNALLLSHEIPELSKPKADAIEQFIKIIKDLQYLNASNPASAMIKYALDITGYKKMIDDGSVEGEARLENTNEMISVAGKYDKLEPGTSLSIFLEEVSLISDLDNLDEQENAVTIMTVHSAKGLEFHNVYLVGLEEGIFPHTRSLLSQEELEEERRLMYVAITRAKDNLYLLHARQRLLYGQSQSNAPSQFLADIPEDLVETNFGSHATARVRISTDQIGHRPIPVEMEEPAIYEYEIGDKITHTGFGQGIVIDITGGIITIAFIDASIGVKKLAISIAPIKKLT